VRLQGSENNTALSAQVIMFIRISGLTSEGIIIAPVTSTSVFTFLYVI
jgi:hypothetical protein